MPTIATCCPHCGIAYRLDAALAGTDIHCKSCGRGFIAPHLPARRPRVLPVLDEERGGHSNAPPTQVLRSPPTAVPSEPVWKWLLALALAGGAMILLTLVVTPFAVAAKDDLSRGRPGQFDLAFGIMGVCGYLVMFLSAFVGSCRLLGLIPDDGGD
jgi:hypothetical protein